MFLLLPLIFGIIGIVFCTIPTMLDMQTYMQMQMSGFSLMFPIMGIIMMITGWFILMIRCKKVGVDKLIAPGRPDRIKWFYIYKDGTVSIVDAERDVEGFLYSRKLDTEAQDLKSYRLFDHSIRFVPEGLGHCVDLNKVLYTYVLKNKWGIKSINEARDSKRTIEHSIDGKQFDKMVEEQDDVREQPSF